MPPVPTFRSSGDLIADRRFAYAQRAFDDKDFEAAADLARQVIELAAGYAPAHALLGRAEAELGRRDAAIAVLRQALALEPEDDLGVRIDLAHLGAIEPEEAITDGYVRALFDDYALRFERHLVKNLHYRGPELIVEALRRASASRMRPFRFRRVFDLGCGTGLMARALQEVFEGVFEVIEGVDLSPRMLAQAAKAHLYERLHESELVTFLEGCEAGSVDLVIAADVFVYMAGLDEVFAEAHRVLGRGGLFAFTVQAHMGEGFALGEDARYAHGEHYLRALADKMQFTILSLDRVSTREDRGEPVPGFLAVLER